MLRILKLLMRNNNCYDIMIGIGDERSEYGLKLIKEIAKELTRRYGKGYDRSNLYHCLKFYKTFPQIVDTACK